MLFGFCFTLTSKSSHHSVLVAVEMVDEEVENEAGEVVPHWKVTYPDDDCEEMDESQIRRYRYPQPCIPPALGRQYQCLELFGGKFLIHVVLDLVVPS